MSAGRYHGCAARKGETARSMAASVRGDPNGWVGEFEGVGVAGARRRGSETAISYATSWALREA